MNRGDRREAIFLTDKDRTPLVGTLMEACGKTHWQVHAWCLMSICPAALHGQPGHVACLLFRKDKDELESENKLSDPNPNRAEALDGSSNAGLLLVLLVLPPISRTAGGIHLGRRL